MGSKSKLTSMKANTILKNEMAQKKSKKENTPDIISKSIFSNRFKKPMAIRKNYHQKFVLVIGYAMGSK